MSKAWTVEKILVLIRLVKLIQNFSSGSNPEKTIAKEKVLTELKISSKQSPKNLVLLHTYETFYSQFGLIAPRF